MPTAEFFKFSKRKNSTKQPTGSGTSYTVNLKSGTSFISPTLLLEISGYPDYNYLVFNGWYYFVRDIVSVRQDLWEIYCDVDSMATAKSYILALKAYVMYDSVANTEIPDNRLPIKTTKNVSVSTAACPFVPDSGCYILSLTGSNDTTGVYKCDSNELAALIDDVSDIVNNFESGLSPYPSSPKTPVNPNPTIEDWWEYFCDSFAWIFEWVTRPVSQFFGSGNIPENIRECKFIPFNVGTSGGLDPIYLGTFATNTSLRKLTTDTVHRTATVSIPWQASDFRRRSPYTDVYLYLPYIGMTKLSSENLTGESTITVAYTLGMRDGSLIVTVSSGGEIIGQYSSNVAASVPVGVSNINIPKAAQSIIMGAAAVATKSIGAIGMAALNFGDSVTPNFSCVGGLDGIAGTATNQDITCYTVFHDTVVAPNTELASVGSPTMAPKALSALTGYCQCSGAHVEAPLPAPILDRVDAYINSGFFIE